MARPRARWRAILALPSVSCFSPNAWVCARQVHSSVLGSPLSLWTPPHLRWLTHDAGARDARPVTFTRYWQPFQPPQINAGAFLPSSTLAFTEALERHDIPTCLELLRADHQVSIRLPPHVHACIEVYTRTLHEEYRQRHLHPA